MDSIGQPSLINDGCKLWDNFDRWKSGRLREMIVYERLSRPVVLLYRI